MKSLLLTLIFIVLSCVCQYDFAQEPPPPPPPGSTHGIGSNRVDSIQVDSGSATLGGVVVMMLPEIRGCP